MTAAVPDPRFRDQLAEDMRDALHASVCDQIPDGGTTCDEIVDLLLPLAAAEVEAAAALRGLLDVLDRINVGYVPLSLRDAMATGRAALASPAPAPRAEEGQAGGFRRRPVDLTPAGPGQDVCGERFGRYGVCDLPKGHPPIAEAMGWLHSQDIGS